MIITSHDTDIKGNLLFQWDIYRSQSTPNKIKTILFSQNNIFPKFKRISISFKRLSKSFKWFRNFYFRTFLELYFLSHYNDLVSHYNESSSLYFLSCLNMLNDLLSHYNDILSHYNEIKKLLFSLGIFCLP